MFTVKGGEYKDIAFKEFITCEEYGPYQSYDEAYKKWRERAWATVDNCHCRFKIEAAH